MVRRRQLRMDRLRQRKSNRRRQAHDDGPDDMPESSSRRDVDTQDRSNASIRKDDPILQSNHKIFLSHSGYQKDFVEELCGDLEKRYRFPFFDRRSSSLPKGERIPELILKAARQCQLAVVVLSDGFFTSKWPMIELNTFVQTRLQQEELKSSTKLKILPLFYGLSVVEFGNRKRRAGWFARWDALAKEDSRIEVKAWKESLKVLASFNGVSYYPDTGAVKAYREAVVDHICDEVPSDIKWDDSNVQGGSSLCQMFRNCIKHIQLSKQYKFRLVGIYGVGGNGKTTACKVLRNGLSQEFKGKVSYIDAGSESYGGSVKEVLQDLIDANHDFLQQLNDGQCWNILRKNIYKQKTFLALDNVWPTSKSIEEAQKYLQVGFHKESVVMVTSRSLQTLMNLGITRSNCFEMPCLGHEDAKNLFLQHAAFGIQFAIDDDKRAIEECVAVCYFHKGNRADGHYLPLALKALGVQLGFVGKSPSEWVRALPKVRDFNCLQEKENPVFSILRSSFDCLPPIHQCLFMDLALYRPTNIGYYPQGWLTTMGLMDWLTVVYDQDMEEIGSMLQHLKGRGLLEDVDMVSQTVDIHDVYREFAKLEAQGKLNESAELEKRRWVYYEDDDYPTELEKEPPYRCWPNLIRMGIWSNSKIDILKGIESGYFSNVVVLKLCGLRNLRGELNVKGLKCLRSLKLNDIVGLDRVDGLQDLTKLAYFNWKSYDRGSNEAMFAGLRMMEQLPASLKILDLCSHYREFSTFRPDVFARCTNLTMVHLRGSRDKNLDFSDCASLQNVCIFGCQEVENVDFNTDCPSLQAVTLACLWRLKCVAGLSPETTSNLQFLRVEHCDLDEIPGLGQMVGLQHLHLKCIRKLKKLPDLQKLTRLQVLDISMMNIEEVPRLSCLRQLRVLRWTNSRSSSMKLSSLSGFEQLEIVDLFDNDGLSSLEGVFGDLPALRHLNLSECGSLARLPDLSRARNLEELDLSASGVELREEDMCMLAALPLLHPLLVTFQGDDDYQINGSNVRIDVVRRKVLHIETGFGWETWEEWTEWDERDLGMLPIRAGSIQKS